MLSAKESATIVRIKLPGSTVLKTVEYGGLYIHLVNTNRPGEELFDPFYSVDKETGDLEEYSIITDADEEVHRLFGFV